MISHPKAEFVFVHEESVLARFVLQAGEYLIGRSPSCQIAIDLDGVDPEHSRLFVERDVWIEDSGSQNGTFLDGERLSTRRQMTPETPVTFGACRGVLRLEQSAPSVREAPAAESSGRKRAAGGGRRKSGAGAKASLAKSAGKLAPPQPRAQSQVANEPQPDAVEGVSERAEFARERSAWLEREGELRRQLETLQKEKAALAEEVNRQIESHLGALEKVNRELEETRVELQRARVQSKDTSSKGVVPASRALVAKARRVINQKIADGAFIARQVDELRHELKQREAALVDALIRRQAAEAQCLQLARQLKRDEEPKRPRSTPKAGDWRLPLMLSARAAVVCAILLAVAFPVLLYALRLQVKETRESQAQVDAARNAAPQLYQEAVELTTQRRFPEALEEIKYALGLCPSAAEYHLLAGHIQEALLRLGPAASAYEHVLAADPQNPIARANLDLCRRILLTRRGVDSLESKYALHRLMMEQQRWPEAVELAEHHLATDRSLVFRTWSALMASHGLAERLALLPDGFFDLNLSDVSAANLHLSLLREMPLHRLDLSRSEVDDLKPLQGLPLRELNLSGTRVRDIAPLANMPLQTLNLANSEVSNIFPLARLQLRELVLDYTRVSDLSVLEGMPLEVLRLAGTPVQNIRRLRSLPLRRLDLSSTRVTTIEDLSHLPLEELNLAHTSVADLQPLRGAHLLSLVLARTEVTSLEPLQEAPLRRLNLAGCVSITSLKPLESCAALERLIIPRGTTNLESLRNMRWLRFLSWEEPFNPESDVDETARHFWDTRATEAAVASSAQAQLPAHSRKVVP